MTQTLAVSAAFSVAAALIYAYVGHRVYGRPTSDDARLAQALFATWWYALAAFSTVGAGLTALAAAGVTDLAIHRTATYVNFLILCLALWALLYYLIYIYTGSRAALWPLTAFYVGYYAAIVYLINAGDPVGLAVGRWTATLEYAYEIEAWIGQVILALLVLPQIGGAIALLWLAFRARLPAQRYRAAMVGGSILVWFTSAYAASLTGIGESDAWQVASRIIGFLAALTILLAYVPPRWIRTRLGIDPLARPTPAGGS